MNTFYYDPLYGRVEIDEMVLDILSKCPELKRLRYIGLMNFKSLKMLSLTSTTRLEHTIGLAYLAQVFSETNGLANDRNNLMVASLFHDVNCGSFGHSVEWAIDRYTKFDHEQDAGWVASTEKLFSLQRKPIFIEQEGIHSHNFDKKYHLNFAEIKKIIKGTGWFFLNNKGVDLDNIDNVFRMALYLGVLTNEDRIIPLKLVKNLIANKNYDNFVINDAAFDLLVRWHQLRSEVYSKFIYSLEYMGFEYLVFKLIAEYTKYFKPEGVVNLFHFTDETLLRYLYEKKNLPDVSNIARRLLLHNLPYTYALIRSEQFNKKENLAKPSVFKLMAEKISEQLYSLKKIPNSAQIDLAYHLTTDDRKTKRKVEIYVDKDGNVTQQSIGDDKRYLLVAILGERQLPSDVISFITSKTIEALKKGDLGIFESVPLTEQSLNSSFLF